MIASALIAACVVSGVSPQTVAAIIRFESGGNPLALHVNGDAPSTVRPRDTAELLAAAEAALSRGHSVDIGLMQVNVRTLSVLRSRISELTDPCSNITVGSRILRNDYDAVLASMPSGQAALDQALSRYNTGDSAAGIGNGYVAGVRAAAFSGKFRLGSISPPAPMNVYHRLAE